MEVDNEMMIFDDDEQKYAGIAACTSAENAPRVFTRVNEVLLGRREKLWRLEQADDDEITHSERSEIPSLTKEVNLLEKLNGQLSELALSRQVELYLRSEED
jgi:hypothetical protein